VDPSSRNLRNAGLSFLGLKAGKPFRSKNGRIKVYVYSGKYGQWKTLLSTPGNWAWKDNDRDE